MSQPGQPNWLGLLQWSLAYSDGTSASTGRTLNEEDKLWLERVMKEAVTDEPARLNEIMLALTAVLDRTPNENDEEMIENSLEEIKSIVDQIDMAQVFSKFGGSKCLLRIINNDGISNELKSIAASVIGTMAQNNILVQDILFKEGFIDVLLKTFATTDSALLSTKILFAVSCIIRGHAALETYFVGELADITLTRALASNHQPLVLRAVFLSNALLSSDSSSTARIDRLAGLLLPSVIGHINSSSVDLSENVAALLTTLLHTHAGWSLLTGTYGVTVEEALMERERWITASSSSSSSSGDSSDDERLSAEEVTCCVGVIVRLRSLLSNEVEVLFPARVEEPEASVTVTTESNDLKKMQIC